MLIYHRKPVEESFTEWMNGCPESTHPADLKRFYRFVKSVYSYREKHWEKEGVFREEIKKRAPDFPEEKIDFFYEKLCTGLAVLRAPKMPLIESGDDGEIREGILENGEIVERVIEK